MAKVTSKLQITIPKSLADKKRIKPGDDVEWSESGDAIVIRRQQTGASLSHADKLKLFDEGTARQKRRQKTQRVRAEPADRGWTREDLYRRGRSR